MRFSLRAGLLRRYGFSGSCIQHALEKLHLSNLQLQVQQVVLSEIKAPRINLLVAKFVRMKMKA